LSIASIRTRYSLSVTGTLASRSSVKKRMNIGDGPLASNGRLNAEDGV
jgi:hypothetical protein